MSLSKRYYMDRHEKETYGRCVGCGILINEAYGHPETPHEQIMKHDNVLSDEECYECIYDRY
jgi:hypothetical protein